MTARRDLALLADAGYAGRTHGGAVLPELAAHEDSFQSRLEQDVEAKVRLAQGGGGHARAERDSFHRLLELGLLRRARDPGRPACT